MQPKNPFRLSHVLLLAGCALPILLILLIPLRGQLSVSDTENRTLAQFPVLSLGGFVSTDFQSQLEDALGDQYPFGETLKGGVIAAQDAVYQQESALLRKVFPASALQYTEIASGYYHFGGDESRIVEKPWAESEYADAVIERADAFADLGVPVSLYFIRNSRAHDFANTGANDAYAAVRAAYHYAQNACFEATDYDEYATLFYASDHHWNHRGADKGYRDIIRLLLGENEATIPVKEELSFPVPFNGSYARQSGRMIGDSQFTVYTYDIKKTITRLNGKNGTYGHQALYEKGRYPDDELRNHYAYYYGGDYGEIIFQTRKTDKTNLLILADSYSNPVNTLIATHFNNTHILDMRYYERDMGQPLDLKAYIAQNDIQQVLLLGDITFFAGKQDGGNQ